LSPTQIWKQIVEVLAVVVKLFFINLIFHPIFLFGQYKYIIQYQVKYGIDKKFSVEKDVKTFSADYILTPKEVKIQAITQRERERIDISPQLIGNNFKKRNLKFMHFSTANPHVID